MGVPFCICFPEPYSIFRVKAWSGFDAPYASAGNCENLLKALAATQTHPTFATLQLVGVARAEPDCSHCSCGSEGNVTYAWPLPLSIHQ